MTDIKPNECVEILEDGSVYYFDLDVCNEEKSQLMEDLHKWDSREL